MRSFGILMQQAANPWSMHLRPWWLSATNTPRVVCKCRGKKKRAQSVGPIFMAMATLLALPSLGWEHSHAGGGYPNGLRLGPPTLFAASACHNIGHCDRTQHCGKGVVRR
mmetsp:Transcript_23153/g.31245  ORF Transcript_23153/g.31245 Transcript_23153/m.31245 type:complete len:110 (-) Transcript_23153:10-339(-)